MAFVTRRQGAPCTEEDLIGWVRERLAHFKAPKRVVFDDLPKTSTGKIEKYAIRQRLRETEMPLRN